MLRLLNSFGFALKGLTYAFKTQLNFRIHLLILAIVLCLGYFLSITTSEWIWIAFATTLVLSTELINTAIEKLVDLVSPEYHAKAGAVKDLAAAAVLICAFFAAVVGLCIFIPKLL